MEYLLSALLLALNLAAYQTGMNRILVLAVGAALFVALMLVTMKKTGSFPAACLALFCHTWQISWMNIFGGSTASLQLPWFYIIGVMMLGYAVLKFRSLLEKNNNGIILATFVCFFVVMVVPELMSASKVEGAKEFIMIGFFAVLVFIAFLLSDTVDGRHREYIEKVYIFNIVLTSVLLLFQSFYYKLTGHVVFKLTVGNYMGGKMHSAKLLMEDTSCSTVALGCAVFLLLSGMNKHNWYRRIPCVLIVAAAMGVTSRRTSVVTLVVVLAAYMFVEYRGILKRTAMIGVYVFVAGLMIFYLATVRTIDDYSQLIYDNGRFENYAAAWNIFIRHPFGIGYDNVYLQKQMGGIIPHNTLLRWLDMGGVWFALPLVIILGYILYKAYKKGFRAEFWLILYTLTAANFIPDIFNARFFVIPCMAVLLLKPNTVNRKTGSSHAHNKKSERNTDNEKNIAV